MVLLRNFDWLHYLENNEDLKKLSAFQAKEHFHRYGLNEGRTHRFIEDNDKIVDNDKIFKLVLMTKNDLTMIKSWIKYHGERFGYENLHIIDDSDDLNVLQYYESIREKGITFYFFKSNLNDLIHRINEVFNQIKNYCDFIIKMDTDEFLAIFDPNTNTFTIDKDNIFKVINTLPLNGLKYKATYTMDNIPNPDYTNTILNTIFSEPRISKFKTFFSAETFKHVDLGSHNGSVLPPYDSNQANETCLAIIHYHCQKYEILIAASKKTCVSHNYINVNDSNETMINKLKKLKECQSYHRVLYYLDYLDNPMAKKNYYLKFANVKKYIFDSLFRVLVKKCIIITTINEPTPAFQKYIEYIKKGYDIIIVGDVKTPTTYNNYPVIFLDIAKQKELFPKLSELLPYNHYCRKNLGYLYAIKNDYEIIYETDDDTFPHDNLLFFENIDRSKIKMISNNKYPNIYNYFTDKDYLYPRGYPLDEITQNNSLSETLLENNKNIKIIQTVINNDPDVDAITRLTRKDYIIQFEKNKDSFYTFDNDVWTQFNTQSTIFMSPDIFYLMYLPSTTTFRVCDILRGYIAQRCLFKDNSSLLFCPPSVYQERNAHDLLKDFKDEILLYTDVKKIIEILEKIQLNGDINDMKLIYNELHKYNYVSEKELIIINEFINIYIGNTK